jgi:hypothetical protein
MHFIITVTARDYGAFRYYGIGFGYLQFHGSFCHISANMPCHMQIIILQITNKTQLVNHHCNM